MASFIASPYYPLVKDIIYLLIALGGVIVACMGLSTWRRQLKGNVEYETARRLYKAVLKVRDAMSYVRNPWIPLSEMESASAKHPEADKTTNRAVYHVRWEKITEAMSELQSEELESEVLWGQEIVEKLKPLKLCVVELNNYVSQFLNPSLRTSNYSSDMIYEFEDATGKKDKFTEEINAAVGAVGNFLKPKYKFSER